MHLKDFTACFVLLVATFDIIKGEFHCFKNYRSNQKTCGGLLRRKILGESECCSVMSAQGYTKMTLNKLGKNKYTCESCEDWLNNRPPTTTPKPEFVCFRKYRPRRKQCGGPMRRHKAATITECCTESTGAGDGYTFLGLDPQGRNRYTCNSCEEWRKQQVTTPDPRTTTEAIIAEWGQWSKCSASCGYGTQTRHRQCRKCDRNSPENYEVRSCLVHYYCEEDGSWGAWSAWGECSQSCNGGMRRRERLCDSPAPRHGGKDCEGDKEEWERCNNHACSVDGNWGPWSRFSDCSQTCGRGEMFRRRECNSPPPFGDGTPCSGMALDTRRCEDRKCPIHGGWSSWEPWSECSGTCGQGLRTRTRTCNRPSPLFGGRNCGGLAEDSEICHNSINCPVHGGWSHWTEYGSCRGLPCQNGVRLRTRECDNPRPQHRGRMCRGLGVERIPCFNSEGCPVDGGWCEFGLWSACSSTCLGELGYQTRRRACYCPPTQHGGNYCEGKPEETQKCEGFNICDSTAIDVSRQR